ncbi:MAG: ATPase, MoxR-like protein ATPase [Candidatus Dadabacteria bacterium CSP1-2]|nr:MAG: ATPase, MoxR-like protein ATPase [Candidatus Dadabacteria bacterium CSP1-2]
MSRYAYDNEEDVDKVKDLARVKKEILEEIGKVIIGQESVIELLIISLMSSGHSLFVGVPGLAKTLLVSTLSEVLNMKFSRVQFTPDLMPSDITGSEVLEEDRTTGKKFFRFIPGPIFCNILLADEINRASPKTQAALLQAMQERKITVAGETYRLEPPFLVFATQNPIEQEGTYPLPEAELDRFMFQIDVDYPSLDEEVEIVRTTTGAYTPELKRVLDISKIIEFQNLVHRVPVSEYVAAHAVKIARATRPDESAHESVKKWVSWGVGPRASQFLILGSKAKAVLEGRFTPTTDDVRFLAPSILKHRIVLNFRAESEGIKPMEVIQEILSKTEVVARAS